MGAIKFLLGLGSVFTAGAMNAARNVDSKKLQAEWNAHNYIDGYRQLVLEQQANYVDDFGGFDSCKLIRVMLEEKKVNYIRAKEILAVVLARHFTEKYGYEYNLSRNIYGVVDDYGMGEYLTKEYMRKDYDKIMNTPVEEMAGNWYLLGLYDAYHAPGRIITRIG